MSVSEFRSRSFVRGAKFAPLTLFMNERERISLSLFLNERERKFSLSQSQSHDDFRCCFFKNFCWNWMIDSNFIWMNVESKSNQMMIDEKKIINKASNMFETLRSCLLFIGRKNYPKVRAGRKHVLLWMKIKIILLKWNLKSEINKRIEGLGKLSAWYHLQPRLILLHK